MDIICGKCGKHFSSIEAAREHRGNCKEDKENDGLDFIHSKDSTLSREEQERIINSIRRGDPKRDESKLFNCPSCHQTSLSKNGINGLYECLNPRCGKKFTKDRVFVNTGFNNLGKEPFNKEKATSTNAERIHVTPNSKKEQVTITNTGIEIRHEGKPTSGSANVPGYVYLNIDCSSSMYGYKLQQAKKGACNFARDALTKNYLTGLIKFDSLATLIFEPCNDISFIESQINTLKVGETTNLEAAIYLSCNLLKELSGPKAIVIVTDGMPNNPGDPQSSLKAGEVAKSQQIDIIAIGTDYADHEFLKKLASRSELAIKVSSEKLEQSITSSVKLLPGNRMPEIKK